MPTCTEARTPGPDLSPEETLILRHTLGLSYYQRTPTRNHSAGLDLVAHLETISGLVDRGFMLPQFTHGPAGREWFYMATDTGIAAALAQPWKELP